MPDLRQKLIDLYSRDTIDTVHQFADYQMLCAEHKNDSMFHAQRFKVETVRKQIDGFLGPRQSHKEQVQFALRLLREISEPGDRSMCRQIILKTYGRHWHETQRDYFDKTSCTGLAARHYFLSFTNRNPGRPLPNVINRNHRFFIIEAIGHAEYKRADQTRNLVAEAIHHLLKNRQLDGFYYPEHLEDNTDVESKIKSNCQGCEAFVQLVQAEMFRHYDNSKNWCLYEYTEVVNANRSDRMLFVQIDDDIREDAVQLNFRSWYENFKKQDAITLTGTPRHKPSDVDQNYNKIWQKLTRQIDASVNICYRNIPD